MLDIVSTTVDVIRGDTHVLHHVHFPKPMGFGELRSTPLPQGRELYRFAKPLDFARFYRLLQQAFKRAPVAVLTIPSNADNRELRQSLFGQFVQRPQ